MIQVTLEVGSAEIFSGMLVIHLEISFFLGSAQRSIIQGMPSGALLLLL
uniref:Uncharacterized protein n=1 Tax=Rhizophora mucronata TaxID=61149 RepID=A0A2P2R0N4_RHIMU